MTKQNDGGPAFPFQANDRSNLDMQTGGMSLRDWFACQALNGLCAGMFEQPKSELPTPDELAWMADTLADAMLKAREVRDDQA